jgi:hypothetical protein
VLSDRSKCDLVSHPCHQGQSKLGTSNYTGKSRMVRCLVSWG